MLYLRLQVPQCGSNTGAIVLSPTGGSIQAAAAFMDSHFRRSYAPVGQFTNGI
jgi:hypothetical protein